jgi:hypothetical protein
MKGIMIIRVYPGLILGKWIWSGGVSGVSLVDYLPPELPTMQFAYR